MFGSKLNCLFVMAAVVLIAGTTTRAVTNFTGAVNSDINTAGNWDNGLPTNTGANDGIVPTGFAALNGSPQNKDITFQGTSGFTGTNFGGNQANGYNITFDGSGSSSFTSNGLFLAWDGGAANKSDMAWNSTGTLNTTRFFIGRFGEGDFVQSAGIVNQNSGGTFDFVIGELNGSQGSSYTMTGGVLNAAGMADVRRGTFNQLGGDVFINNSNGIDFNQQANNEFIWNLGAGTLRTTDIRDFDSTDAINFLTGSTGILEVLTSNKSILDIQNLITAGRITLNGAIGLVADFNIQLVQNQAGASYTQVALVGSAGSGVPEPTTALLAILGCAALGRRRREGRQILA